MKPKSERDCPFCVKEKGRQGSPKPEMPMAWSLRKGRGGPIKKLSTQGYFCPNPECEYYMITDENIHALVGYGSHGKQEPFQDLKCQACRKKFTSRRNTILYRLKTQSGLVEKIMWLLALGVDASALEEVFGVREITIRAWLCRSGMQGKKLHERMIVELELIHVQLDELWGNVKSNGRELWLWTASDAKTKILVVMQVGGRTQEMAECVVHELKKRLKAGCAGVQHRWTAALFLCVDIPLRKMGRPGWKEAGIGADGWTAIWSGDQSSAEAQNGRSRAEDVGGGGGRISKGAEEKRAELAE